MQELAPENFGMVTCKNRHALAGQPRLFEIAISCQEFLPRVSPMDL
jgi:hypothetical protein